MRISRKAEYGLIAMVHLAKSDKSLKGILTDPSQSRPKASLVGKVVSIREISNIEKVPFEFLSKILLVLEKAKLVKARHGVNGGYMLAKPAQKISANDIVSVLEDNQKTVDCALCFRKSKCLTKDVWVKVENALNKTLSEITLATLIK